MDKCPKCGFKFETDYEECPACGVIIEKYLKMEKGREAEKQKTHARISQDINGLAQARSLYVRQKKEMGEILLGFETRNRYIINNGLFSAVEEGGSVSAIVFRQFFKAWRPFVIRILSSRDSLVFRLERPFRFYFHRLDIYRSDGAFMGSVRRRFSIISKNYSVLDGRGREIFTLHGPFYRPWTFRLMINGEHRGEIVKKWSGLFRETFSDADNFGVNFPEGMDAGQKALLMGAVFLVDFVHFEK